LWLLAVALCAVGGAALQMHGWFYAPSQGLLAGAGAAALRSVVDRGRERRERRMLAEALGAYLSPQLARRIFAGRGATQGARRAVALLFADLRGFTAWSETADPAVVLETLNRYYAAITPVLHAHGGMIDNFRGDGVMVVFDAADAADAAAQPCIAAFAAARAVCAAVERFAAAQAARGQARLDVSIGLAYGEVVVGDLGSADRKDYTALGDAVNVAARLQDLAKSIGLAVLMTEAFAQLLPEGQEGISQLGRRELKGHSPVAVCGWQESAPGA
jgi:class 3 adenylate cyclase